jgi:hypothetical protein
MKPAIFWFLLTLAGIAALTFLGPPEKSLGSNVRIVYLHGAWVWTSLAAFVAAALAGAAGLLTRKGYLHRWSLALGRTGLFFWVAYLPLSMWASQLNWNGLYLAEPRWRIAFIFAITGLLLQFGLALIDRPALASAGNILFLIALVASLSTADRVMHPASPIFTSGSLRIQLFFISLVTLTLLAGAQIALGWFRWERRRAVPAKIN